MFSRECVVYPTSRCIRNALESASEGMLPRHMSMGEFLSRCSIAPGRIVPDEDLRLLALHEASDFKAFASLEIERSFFSFIQNAQYIFRFFEELASEQVSVDTLRDVDVYGEYEEHIAILIRLRERYREICERKGWADPIFAVETMDVDTAFLSHFDSVRIEVEGYLSRREIDILRECARTVELQIVYNATPYNRKMSSRLAEMGFDISEGKHYRLSLSQNRVLEESELRQNRALVCDTFQSRLAQAGYIKATVESFVLEGIAPENIAVVLPDESFAPMLGAFNDEGNFNFAMGRSFETAEAYRDVESIMLYLDEPNVLNRARIRHVGADRIEWLKTRCPKPFAMEELEVLWEMVSDDKNDDAAREIIQEELRRFSHLAPVLENLDFKSVLRIFMNRLRNRTFDDVRGGKVTVMGLLETRGSAFEGVVVVDFNEGYVPHKSDKDLFLNTQTRKFAGLPTSGDRESLQKHYYAMLFNRAKRVAIACVQNAESVPSRFLLQMKIPLRSAQYRYEEALFPPFSPKERLRSSYAGEYDFTAHPLSASSLKSFLTCRRQFYYRYVLHLVPHELPRDLSEERDIGNVLHASLEALYRGRDAYRTPAEIKKALEALWGEHVGDDALQRHMKRLWLEKLETFYRSEIRRFEEGWRVAYREKELSTTIEGITLVGRVDRIDMREGAFEVIDYKSGSYPDVDREPREEDTDYQLSVYAFLAATLGEVQGCGYYDLGRGELFRERFLEAKNARLREIMKTLAEGKTWDWEMCEDLSRCRNCAYVYLCNREAMRGV